MILPDVNVLLYAFRADAEDHAHYKSWLEDVVNGDATYGISPQVLASVIRISTHPRIYVHPTPRKDAFAFCQALLEQPNATVITPGERHWELFEDLCEKANAKGNLIQDAWFAALALEAGCEWLTTDRDYGRFPGLSVRRPF